MTNTIKKFFGKIFKNNKASTQEFDVLKNMSQSEIINGCLSLVNATANLWNLTFDFDVKMVPGCPIKLYALSKEQGKYNNVVYSCGNKLFLGYIFSIEKITYDNKSADDFYIISFSTRETYYYTNKDSETYAKAEQLYNLCNEKIEKAEIARKEQEQQKIQSAFLEKYGIRTK